MIPDPRVILAALALLLAVAGWALIERAGRHWAETRADIAEAAVTGRDRAIETLQRRMADQAAAATQRETIVRTIHAQPRGTNACVSSAPVNALLRGLREPGASGGAGSAADLPGRTGGAGR